MKWFGKALRLFSHDGRKVVKFQNHSNEPTILLPKPEYLALHAVIANILDETRLGEYFNTMIDYFIPNNSSVLTGKFTSEDLAQPSRAEDLIDAKFLSLVSCTPKILLNRLP